MTPTLTHEPRHTGRQSLAAGPGLGVIEEARRHQRKRRIRTAAVLGVNKNTVLRALHTLRDEGLLEFRRGRGITVAGTPQRGAVLARTRELLDLARHHGFGREEVIQIIENLP